MGGISANVEDASAIPSVSAINLIIIIITNLPCSNRQLAFAAQYVQLVAKSISEHMQAAVTIMIIGPVPDRNGEVEVRRYVTRPHLY
jgi:hypothetical protein